MSIDRYKIKSAFRAYTERYDIKNEKIRLKVVHTEKVAAIAEKIAASLWESQKDIDLAWAAGMLHDIGRFEQVKRYGTFKDADSVDHAKFGADLLFCEGLIDEFGADVMEKEEFWILETAIRQHNRYRVDPELDERTRMFCDILRDADKIDIIRVNIDSTPEAIYGVTGTELRCSSITPEVMDSFRKEICVSRDIRKTPADFLLGHISFVFELVYPESVKILRQQGYIDELLGFRSKNPQTARLFDEVNGIVIDNLRKREQENV